MDGLRVNLFEYTEKNNVQSARFQKSSNDSLTINGVKPFEDYLRDSITGVNELQQESDSLISRLATGDVDDISEVIMASSRAEIAFKMLMEVRNKLLEAYQQISRIQG